MAPRDPKKGDAVSGDLTLRLYKMAQEVAEVGHWLWRAGTDELTWSDEVYRIYGLDPDTTDVTPKLGVRAYHKLDRKRVTEHLNRAVKTKQDFHYEARIVRPDGDIRHVRVKGQCELEDNGEVAALFGVIQDVSGQRESKEIIDRLVRAIDVSDETFAIYDNNDRLVFCNSRFKRLNKDVPGGAELGVTFEEHVRARLKVGLYPSAKGREEEWLAERLARHRNPTGPFEHQRNDGKWILVSEERLVDGFSIFRATDITDLKETERALADSEQRFKDYARSSSDWFWEMDENLRYTDFTMRHDMSHARAVGGYIGRHREDLTIDDTSTPEWEDHRSALRDRKPFKDFRYRMETDDGRIVHVSVSGVPVFDGDGNFRGYRGSGRNITDQVKADADLRRAMLDARRGAEAKTRFLATMSHEFRTPLNAIIGFSDMIQRRELGPDAFDTYVQYASNIHASGQRMLEMVNDILDLSTIEAGKRFFQSDLLDMRDLITECVQELELPARGRSVDISVSVKENAAEVQSDRRSLQQIIVNLLSNALKYTQPGGRITVSVARCPAGHVMIRVSDTGTGMSDELVSKLGEPFLRSQESPDTTHDGTGLGLSIVKNLVDALGGMLDIDSEAGKGTTVSVTLLNDDL